MKDAADKHPMLKYLEEGRKKGEGWLCKEEATARNESEKEKECEHFDEEERNLLATTQQYKSLPVIEHPRNNNQ